jgi:tripartite-type tricarboxylate transporter receptor subunit TctC
MKNIAKAVVAAVFAGSALLAAAAARADDYPKAPIHLICGFSPGTTADISARVVGAKMGQILGQ